MISIHAPREGGDFGEKVFSDAVADFNPRPPRGGRPLSDIYVTVAQMISIHAPREGGDSKDAQFYLRIFGK